MQATGHRWYSDLPARISWEVVALRFGRLGPNMTAPKTREGRGTPTMNLPPSARCYAHSRRYRARGLKVELRSTRCAVRRWVSLL